MYFLQYPYPGARAIELLLVVAVGVMILSTAAWVVSSDKDDALSRYAISSVPTYILIGPDGKLIHRGNNIEEIAEILRRSNH